MIVDIRKVHICPFCSNIESGALSPGASWSNVVLDNTPVAVTILKHFREVGYFWSNIQTSRSDFLLVYNFKYPYPHISTPIPVLQMFSATFIDKTIFKQLFYCFNYYYLIFLLFLILLIYLPNGKLKNVLFYRLLYVLPGNSSLKFSIR